MAEKVEPQTTSSSATEQRSASQAGAGTSERVTPAIGQAPASSSSSNAAASLATPPSTGSAGGGGTGTGAVTPGIAAAAQGAAVAGGETVTGGSKCLDATNPAVWKSLGVEMPYWAPSDPQRAQLTLELAFPGITGGVPGMPRMKTPEEVRENIRNPQPQMYAAPSEEKEASNPFWIEKPGWAHEAENRAAGKDAPKPEFKVNSTPTPTFWEAIAKVASDNRNASPGTQFDIDGSLEWGYEVSFAAVVEAKFGLHVGLDASISLVRVDSNLWRVEISGGVQGNATGDLSAFSGNWSPVNPMDAGKSMSGRLGNEFAATHRSPLGAAVSAIGKVPAGILETMRPMPLVGDLAGWTGNMIEDAFNAPAGWLGEGGVGFGLGEGGYQESPLTEKAYDYGYSFGNHRGLNWITGGRGESMAEDTTSGYSDQTMTMTDARHPKGKEIHQRKRYSASTESSVYSEKVGPGFDLSEMAHAYNERDFEKTIVEEEVAGDLLLDNNGRYRHEYVAVSTTASGGVASMSATAGERAVHGTSSTWNEDLQEWIPLYNRTMSSRDAGVGRGKDGKKKRKGQSRGSGSFDVGGSGNHAHHGSNKDPENLSPIPGTSMTVSSDRVGDMKVADFEVGIEGQVTTKETIGTETLAYVKQTYMRGAEGGSYVDEQGERHRSDSWQAFLSKHDGSLRQIQQNMIEPEPGTPEHRRWYALFGKSDGLLCAEAHGPYEDWLSAVEASFEAELGIRRDIDCRAALAEIAPLVQASMSFEASHRAYKLVGAKASTSLKTLAELSNWGDVAEVLRRYDHGREERIDTLTTQMHELTDGVDWTGSNHDAIQRAYDEALGITFDENGHMVCTGEVSTLLAECEAVYLYKYPGSKGFVGDAEDDYSSLSKHQITMR